MSVQTLVIMAGSALLLASSVLLVRRRLLSVRYGLGWISVALLLFAGSPLLTIAAEELQDTLNFTPTGFSAAVALGFMMLICLQLSISLSGVHRAVQDLAEHAALTERRLRQLENAQPADDRTRIG